MTSIAKSLTELNTFLSGKNAQTIFPIPDLDPNQRGPTCGFYALAYVLKYWHERSQHYGGDYKSAVQEPLKARANIDKPKDKTGLEKQKKKDDAKKGTFTSLRQFGKFHKLTQYGSVFNAGDLLTVAKGESSQYAGNFDGQVIKVSTSDFSKTVKVLLDWECPVIVPYDVSIEKGTAGEPVNKDGNQAHWIAILGWYSAGGKDRVVYYNWGEFYDASLDAFAVSNNQLTVNKLKPLQKTEVRSKTGDLVSRDYRDPILPSGLQSGTDKNTGKVYTARSGIVQNIEHNEPGRPKNVVGEWNRPMASGLRNRVVAVYRKEDATEIRAALGG